MESKSMSTFMVTNLKKLSDYSSNLDLVDPTVYRLVTGYLMYLVNTGTDIFLCSENLEVELR